MLNSTSQVADYRLAPNFSN